MTGDLIDRIKGHEGLRLKPYLDTTGNWTIGYGHRISPEQATGIYANGISQPLAQTLLQSDIAAAHAELLKDMPWVGDLPQYKQDIMTEMVFQLGIGGLYTFKNFLYCARCGDDDGAAHGMLDSEWHKQTPDRCEELAALWLNSNVE